MKKPGKSSWKNESSRGDIMPGVKENKFKSAKSCAPHGLSGHSVSKKLGKKGK